MLDQYGFQNIDLNTIAGPFGLYEAAKDSKDEILYVMEEHRKRFDPSWKHHFMSMKVSDMTGYEYKTYLDLITKAGA